MGNYDSCPFYHEKKMSFGYLIITPQSCELLTKSRNENFSLIMKDRDLCVYFRFFEGDIYTARESEVESCITTHGYEWLKRIYEYNHGKFIFSDVLLQKREGEVDFAEMVLKSIKNNRVSVINIQPGLKINIREIYQIEI